MTTHRPLLALALPATLSVPAAVAARDVNEAIADPGTARTIADTRPAELEALMPDDFAVVVEEDAVGTFGSSSRDSKVAE